MRDQRSGRGEGEARSAKGRGVAGATAGCLYVVATPVGNLEDISPRARRVLAEVDWVACEDTRRSGRLLQHLGIRTRLISFWQGNEASREATLLARLCQGESGALVSDGGTPLISDPGYSLVREARDQGIRVVPIPGPCAAITALCAAGLPAVPFLFLGFPSRSPARLRRLLASFRDLEATLVLYESPLRIGRTLEAALEVLGEREAVLARELSKLHEELRGGTLSSLRKELDRVPLKGEVTLVIRGAPRPEEVGDEDLDEALQEALARGRSPREAAIEVAADLEVPRRRAYSRAHQLTREEDRAPDGLMGSNSDSTRE